MPSSLQQWIHILQHGNLKPRLQKTLNLSSTILALSVLQKNSQLQPSTILTFKMIHSRFWSAISATFTNGKVKPGGSPSKQHMVSSSMELIALQSIPPPPKVPPRKQATIKSRSLDCLFQSLRVPAAAFVTLCRVYYKDCAPDMISIISNSQEHK